MARLKMAATVCRQSQWNNTGISELVFYIQHCFYLSMFPCLTFAYIPVWAWSGIT